MFLPTSCGNDDDSIEVTSLNFNVPTLKLYVGDSEKLSVTASPENASFKNLIWSTSDENVSVDDNGVVTGLKEGYTTVTVSTKDAKVSKTIVVGVISPIQFEQESYRMYKGESITPVLIYLNDYSKNSQLIWSIEDNSIASISESGIVTSIKSGNTILKVKDNKETFSASTEIFVNVSVEQIELNHTSLQIPEGKEYQLIASIYPEDAVNKNVSWSSSNTKVVSVNNNGLINGLKPGKATITAITEDGGFKATCEVEVSSTENIEFTPYDDGIKW